MSADVWRRARPIADAVLYEGYALYPYRASSVKNRKRWMFGSLVPEGMAEAVGEPSRMQCVCLLEGDEETEIRGLARFLRFEAREQETEAWEEAAVEEIVVGPLRVGDVVGGERRTRISLPGMRALGADGIERTRRAVEGEVGIAVERVGEGVYRVSVAMANTTPAGLGGAEARLASMASAHALLAVRGGAFVSSIDPPAHLSDAAARCENRGTWPVLAGAAGERDLVFCSPIILEDHPRVAPESPGDLFDGTEMDEMLTLRILTMTEAEKREAAANDQRVRALMERTHELAEEEIARMHGAVRSFDLAAPAPATVRVGEREIGPGTRVRLRPRGRSDIFDLALAGQDATIATIEQDVEDRTYVTVTIDADPGRDLGARGMPGHRFFFRLDEVEPIEHEEARP